MNEWLVIKIGSRQYAINSEYVIAITGLKHEAFVQPSSADFTLGYYNLFGAVIPVLDGYKLMREESAEDKNLAYIRELGTIGANLKNHIENLPITLASGSGPDIDETLGFLSEKIGYIAEHTIDSISISKLIDKLCKNMSAIKSRINDIIVNKETGNYNTVDVMELIDGLQKDCSYLVYSLIDKIITTYSSQISVLCIVFNASGRKFGLTAEALLNSVNLDNKVVRDKRTVLSMGFIKINSNEYNVLDLTKLGKIAEKQH